MQLQWCLWSKNRKSLFLDLRSSNPQKKRDWLENPPWMKTYFLLNMGIFQPVMLVFGGDIHRKEYSDMRNCRIWDGKPLCKLHVLLSNTDLVLPRCPWHDGHYEGCGLCKLFQPPRSFQMERLPPNRTHHGCSTIWHGAVEDLLWKNCIYLWNNSFFRYYVQSFLFCCIPSKAWDKNT